MRRSSLLAAVAGLLGSFTAPAGAVHLSPDNFGQVVIFPYAFASESHGRQTLIELRNSDPARHLLVSFQVKHLGGRPLLSANVVVGPNGAYATALIGSEDGVYVAQAPAGQCAAPDLSLGRNFLSYDFVAGEVSLESTQRFTVEAYALGYIAPEVAADCAALRARYEVGGVWAPRNSVAFRNADVSAPENSLTGWATIIDTRQVTALHLRPLVLADFTATAMNSAPVVATRPSLRDVNPAVSTRSLTKSGPGGGPEQAVSTWAEPINAIDALFMSTAIETNVALGGVLSASSQIIAYYPTRAYHLDHGFWSLSGQSPFGAESDDVVPRAFGRDGAALDVFPGADDCGRNDASQLEITGLRLISLTGFCGEGEAFVRVDGDTGTLVLDQLGEPIVSLEGHRYQGLPVTGHTLITLRTRFENGVPLARALSYAWARPMPAKSAIAID